jgi:hypothetical protein
MFSIAFCWLDSILREKIAATVLQICFAFYWKLLRLKFFDWKECLLKKIGGSFGSNMKSSRNYIIKNITWNLLEQNFVNWDVFTLNWIPNSAKLYSYSRSYPLVLTFSTVDHQPRSTVITLRESISPTRNGHLSEYR